MKRAIVLMALLALFLLPIANPSTSSIPAAIVDEAQEAPFLTAVDGDESTESITSFSETTDDDVLYYPDGYKMGLALDDYRNDMDTPTWVIAGPGSKTEAPANLTFDYTGALWAYVYTNAPSYSTVTDKFYIDFDYRVNSITVDNFRVYIVETDGFGGAQNGFKDLNPAAADTWYSECLTVDVPADGIESLMFGMYDAASEAAQLVIRNLVFADYESHSGYQEDFMDVSDWNAFYHTEISTDGDVANITCNLATYGAVKSTNTEGWVNYTVSAGDRAEIRLLSTSTAQYYFKLYYDDGGVTGDWIVWAWSSTYGTRNTIISNNVPVGAVIYEVRFYIKNVNQWILPDYLQIGPSTEFGFQHDGSTVAGVTGYNSPTISSDDDILNVTGTHAVEGGVYISLDTTATTAYIDTDYYPFIEIRSKYSNGGAFRVRTTDEGGNHFYYLDDSGSWTSNRINLKADSDEIYALLIYDNVDNSQQFEIDFIQLYSIANFSSFSSMATNEYLYVDSGVLHWERSTSSTMYAYYENNLLSVNTATYNVWNCTVDDASDFGFDTYVSAWYSTYAESHGELTSGTLTRFRLKGTGDFTISAIKFIEDSTAPDIFDKFVNPTDPDDDESVTITAVTYDAVEVWEVTINAVVYPAGFSDVDYSMTEQTADVLWSYGFSTLLAGYYLFQVTASDCANTYSEYIPVTVRESTITVEEITLIGAGSDFTMMQFSARINKDCSYVIYEESENNAEAATHSGSVSEPSFNLAWTKLDTTDTNVNFTIKFTNGTLTYNYTSQYQVAQTVLSVTSYDWALSETQVTLSYQTSKSGTYTLYLDDVQGSTSSFVAGSNFLNWSRPSAVNPAEIDAAVKLTDGTTTIWLNQTYSEYSLTAFSIQTLFMDLTDPSISAIFTTSWGNATGYLYEDDVQKATGAEGTTLSYTKSTTAGTYAVALKIDAGGEVAWYNTTYTIATTELRVEEERIETSDTYAYCRGYLTLNADYKVYEETVEVATGSVTAGSIEIRWTKASNSVANVTVLFTSGGQEYPVYGSYQVAAQVTFVVESWWMDLNLGVESYVEFYVLSSFENATVYVYDNNTLMTTVTESAGGAYSYFWMSESEGLHTITLNITHGATVHTRTRTYYVPDWAATGLVMRWDLWTFQDNYTMLELESNWMNCTYYVYLNSSLVATSANDPVILNFTRAINLGTYNLTIYADAGAQTYTIKNIRYIITEEGVSYDYSSVVGGRSVREGDLYEGDVYEGDTHENPPGIYMTAETAATIAVSTVFIFFLAVLFMNSRVKKAQLDRDKKGTQ